MGVDHLKERRQKRPSVQQLPSGSLEVAEVRQLDLSEGEQDEGKTESVPEWWDTTVPLSLSFPGKRGDKKLS
jgi:hypothetical protein